MYDIDRRVYIKSLDCLGTISERNFEGRSPRRATYLVQLKDGGDYLTSSKDLRGADHQCEQCLKWFPESSFNGVPQPRDPEGYIVAMFCFVCYLKFKKEYGYV